MRSLILSGLVALMTAPVSAHPYHGSCAPRAFARFGYWSPRPLVVVRPATFYPTPTPVVVYHPWHRHCSHRRW